jgi:hypothetical protein
MGLGSAEIPAHSWLASARLLVKMITPSQRALPSARPQFSMTTPKSIHELLANALRERRGVIADREWYTRDPAGHLDRLRTISEEITSLQEQLPAPVDPRLAHFLERCSYDKALAFLEAR